MGKVATFRRALLQPRLLGAGALIFKNFRERERERLGSVFYIIHKKYIF
jgi:hypothetical protein